MRAHYIGFFAALFAVILWSGNFIVAQAVAKDIPPIQLNFWRWVLATLFLLPFTLKSMREEWSEIWKYRAYISFVSFMGISIMNTFIYKAGQSTSSINMALLVPSASIFIMLLSRILHNEPITPRRFFGVIIVLIGIASIISQGDINNILAVQFNVGDFWMLGATLSFALYSLYVRKRPPELSLTAFNGITFLVGTLIMLPFVIIEYSYYGAPTFNEDVLISIVYAGIGCSLFAFILWTKAIICIGPVKAGFIYYTMPFFTAIEAWWILGEHITFAHIVGGTCIILGILVATLEAKPKVID